MNILKNTTLLVIDDEIENLVIIEAFFKDLCQKVILQTEPLLALKQAQNKSVDIILLDIRMPEIDGYETCQRLKENPKTAHIPVIFLSSLTRANDKVKGFNVGGVDYITKPFQIEEMVARIESCLKLHQQLQKNTLNLQHFNHYLLTKYEFDILTLYIDGYSRKKIAQQIYVSEHTVKWHLAHIFQKLDVNNRAELLKKIHDN